MMRQAPVAWLEQSASRVRFYAALLAVLGWAAVLLQSYWAVETSLAKATSLPGAIVDVLSYFTILTNILVASWLTATLLKASKPKGFLSPSPATALTTYIVIVGCVYGLILHKLWAPAGLHLVVDSILHYVVPIGFLLYWILAVPKGALQYSSVWSWTIYPFTYFVYSAIRGYVIGFFPYPFINFAELGYWRVSMNVAVLVLAFVGAGLVFIAADGLIARRLRRTRS